jgi:hypothetical protein
MNGCAILFHKTCIYPCKQDTLHCTNVDDSRVIVQKCILPPSFALGWRLYAPLKCRSASLRIHAAISHNAVIFILSAQYETILWRWDFYSSPCGKCMSLRVFNMDYVEGSWMTFSVDYCAHTSQVTPSSDHTQITYSQEKNWENMKTWLPGTYKQQWKNAWMLKISGDRI